MKRCLLVPLSSCLLVLLLIGCGSTAGQRGEPGLATGNAMARAQAHVSTAHEAVKRALAEELFWRKHNESADLSLTRAESDLVESQTALSTMTKRFDQAQDTIVEQQARLDAYRHRWLGDRTVRCIAWICGIWAGLGILGAGLSIAGGGWMGFIGAQVLHLLPLSNPFDWFVRMKRT